VKLAFYSDQIVPQNRNIDELVVAMLSEQARIGFVPSGGDPEGKWFEDRRGYYARGGLRLTHSHDPIGADENSLSALLTCDAIHLSGGNTRKFLASLESGGMVEPLRDYARRGGPADRCERRRNSSDAEYQGGRARLRRGSELGYYGKRFRVGRFRVFSSPT
jgi:dipeptidase E